MSNRMTTYKCFLSTEKEEKWLEEMAGRGWKLVKVSSWMGYTFEQGEPEQRVYKIDYRSFTKASDREDYLALFQDSGWQAVMPKEVNYAFYFYSNGEGARRDIFSDEASRAQRNLRYVTLMGFSLVPAFLPLFVLYLTGTIPFSNVGYQTPGLWQMQGWEFVFHFLFETPFVVLRAGAFWLPLIPIGLGAFFLGRYYWMYRRVGRQERV